MADQPRAERVLSPAVATEWGEACRGFAAITPMLIERGLLSMPRPALSGDAATVESDPLGPET